jgi:hypothetical protein
VSGEGFLFNMRAVCVWNELPVREMILQDMPVLEWVLVPLCERGRCQHTWKAVPPESGNDSEG